MIKDAFINDILYSKDKELLNLSLIHDYLSMESYWAKGIPIKTLETAINSSICYGAYYLQQQIAFARVITDRATFAYLADVFVLKNFRSKGISVELIKFILADSELINLRRFMLATKDAHSLYEKFGFKSLASPERFMELKRFENYTQV